MRVMQINAVSGILSTGRTTKELALALQAEGHETSIVYSEGTCEYSDGYQMRNRLDKKIHALISRITGLVGYFSWWETRKLLKYIGDWKPDIVHLRNLHSNYICIPMLLKYLSRNKIATVITLHDCFFFTGKCCHYTITNCYAWETGCGHCPRLHNDNKSWLFDRTGKMQKDKAKFFSELAGMDKLAVVGVSQWVTNEARRSRTFQRVNNMQHIYNWIDLEQFQPQDTRDEIKRRLGVEMKKVVLGVSTFWSASKGLNDFIKLAERMTEVAFVLVGDFREICDLPSNVIMIGKTHNMKELIELYSMADVFFNPSIEETFGKVTAEALACGTPVIVYNTTACPELVGKNCGKVIEQNDFDAAEAAVGEVLSYEKNDYTDNCRKFAAEKFNLKTNVKQYIALYQKLL